VPRQQHFKYLLSALSHFENLTIGCFWENTDMTQDEFQKLYPVFGGWIDVTLSNNANEAESVTSLNFSRLSKYFKPHTLQTAKVVRLSCVPVPPFRLLGLDKFTDSMPNDLDGITYKDTFFIKETKARDEALHFHELVHFVQWRKLGEKSFLFRYANELEAYGYLASPLEKMAYSMEEDFKREQLFDAEAQIINLLVP